MSPDEPEEPRRHGSEEQELAGHPKIPAGVPGFYFVNALPRHQEKTRDGNQIDQRHKHFAELIPLLHPPDPLPAIVPVQSGFPLHFLKR